jgi:hypothetical protein
VAPSSRPTSRASTERPLNWKEEERATTRRPEKQQSAPSSSSAIPSQK